MVCMYIYMQWKKKKKNIDSRIFEGKWRSQCRGMAALPLFLPRSMPSCARTWFCRYINPLFLDISCFLWIWGYYDLTWMVGKCMDWWSNGFICFCLIRLVEHKVICFCFFSWILAFATLKFYFSVWFFFPHRFEVIMTLIWMVGNCMSLWSNELICCCLIRLI